MHWLDPENISIFSNEFNKSLSTYIRLQCAKEGNSRRWSFDRVEVTVPIVLNNYLPTA